MFFIDVALVSSTEELKFNGFNDFTKYKYAEINVDLLLIFYFAFSAPITLCNRF